MFLLESFRAVRYRGIDGLALPRLSRANLITGANGVGKTALIEAMWLFIGRYNPELLWNSNVQRSTTVPTLNPISTLTDGDLELHGTERGTCHGVKFVFEKLEIGETAQKNGEQLPPVRARIRVQLDGEDVNDAHERLRITPAGTILVWGALPVERPTCIIESARFQYTTSDEHFRRYSDLVRESGKKKLVTSMNLLAPGTDDVEILTDDQGKFYLSVMNAGAGQRRLHDLGGGAVSLFRLLLDFYASRDGVLLSDELENGIHHSVQRRLWDSVRQWMDQWNVQFFATTHSGEFIDAAIDAFEDAPEELSIHQLYRNENTGRTEAATFTGEALAGARDLNLEVR